MIDIIFQFGGEPIFVRIDRTVVLFGSNANSIGKPMMAPISGLKLDKAGVLKEFPDLKDNIMWRDEAIKRFKDRIDKLGNEEEIANYIINDLAKFGYIPKYKQKAGFRMVRL